MTNFRYQVNRKHQIILLIQELTSPILSLKLWFYFSQLTILSLLILICFLFFLSCHVCSDFCDSSQQRDFQQSTTGWLFLNELIIEIFYIFFITKETRWLARWPPDGKVWVRVLFSALRSMIAPENPR